MGQAQAFKRLGRGDFVDEVQINVKQGASFFLADDVGVPDFLEKCLGFHNFRREPGFCGWFWVWCG